MVGVTHNEQNILFAKGLLASAGIESMAKTGATDLLAGEINASVFIRKVSKF
jgi:hypothetical protein